MRTKIIDSPHRNPGICRKIIAGGLIVWAIYLLVDLVLAVFFGGDGLPLSSMTVGAFYPGLLSDDFSRDQAFPVWAAVVTVAFISLAWIGWHRKSRSLAWCFLAATLGSTGVAVARILISFASIKC